MTMKKTKKKAVKKSLPKKEVVGERTPAGLERDKKAKEVLQMIEQAAKERHTMLDLSRKKVTSLPTNAAITASITNMASLFSKRW